MITKIPIYAGAATGAIAKAYGMVIPGGESGGGGGGGDGGGDDPIPPSPTPSGTAPALGGATQYWYGRVNYWSNNTSILDQDISLMKSVGLTGYIIEMAGWRAHADQIRQSASSSAYINYINQVKSSYSYLLDKCRTNGIWLFCCIVNDNALSTKHGDKKCDPSHFYHDFAPTLLQHVIACGKENVVVQPVSELSPGRVSGHPGPNWQKNTISTLKNLGYILCNNKDSTPSDYEGCHYRAWHPDHLSNISSSNPGRTSSTFIISDNGTIISELNGGENTDKVNADCNVSKVKSYRIKCSGYVVGGYYDYKRSSYNPSAITAFAGH